MDRQQPATPLERASIWLRRARMDHLLQNSFFILLTTATMGGFGFLFWLLNARIFRPEQVGVATTLISGTILISFVSLLGFDSAFIRFLPTSKDRDAEINTGLLLVFLTALVMAAAYILVVPSFVPALRFVRHSPLYLTGFVLLTAAAAINLATDSVFVAFRAARFNLVVDGFILGGAKLALPLLLVGLGGYGIFAASGVASLVAASASLFFLARRFGFRPRFRMSRDVLRKVLGFSAPNYAANLLNILPILIVPLIVINERGAAQAGYYYVSFQLATLLFTVSYAISQSLFAEGSHAGADLRQLIRRSSRILGLTALPAMALLCLGGPWLLMLFGTSYRHHATAALVVFGLAVPAVSLNSWTTSLMRITKRLKPLVASNVVTLVSVCGLALAWGHRGLGWVAGAWLASNLASGTIGLAVLFGELRDSPKAVVVA